MNIRFSAPSKTFLAGEYAVLAGGPALIINSTPRFSFSAVRGEPGVVGIPAGSPAAKWIEQRSPLLAEWKIEFTDPHLGKGGFGASSAQFLFVHALTTLLQISVSRAVEGLDLPALLQDFKVLSGGLASGADLLAQAVGQVAQVTDASPVALAWPFPELDFAILRTGVKVQTHQHLAELDRVRLVELVTPAQKVCEYFKLGATEKFVHAVRDFGLALRELQLQAPATLALLTHLDEQSWCKAAKGCGALGADTVLVLFASADRETATQYFATQNLENIAAVKDLSQGLQMDWSWS